MQENSARGALPPIALGHAAAVGVVVAAGVLARMVMPLDVLKIVIAAILVTLGFYSSSSESSR